MLYNVNPVYWPLLIILDATGYIIFFWKKFIRLANKPRKILIMELDHIGDMIMATPFLKNLRSNFPKSEIHILCRELTTPIITNNPYVDRIIEYNPFWFVRKDKFSLKSLLKIIKKLREEEYDLIFDLHDDPRNILLGSVTGGFLVAYGKRGLGFLLNKKVNWKKEERMTIERNLDILRGLNLRVTDIKTELFPTKEKIPALPKKFVIIQPTSGRSEKDLSDAEIFEFAEYARKNRLSVVFTGNGKKEGDRIRRLQKKIPFKTSTLANKTSLNQLILIVKKAYKVFAPDTAIVHIANSLNVPFKCVYKSTEEKVWGYSSNNERSY